MIKNFRLSVSDLDSIVKVLYFIFHVSHNIILLVKCESVQVRESRSLCKDKLATKILTGSLFIIERKKL